MKDEAGVQICRDECRECAMKEERMKKIELTNSMQDVMELPQLSDFKRFLIYSPLSEESPAPEQEKMNRSPLSSLAEIGWSPEGIVNGLNFLTEALETRRVSRYFIYPEEETSDDPRKKDVNLVRILPETPDPSRPFIILCAGGAYMSVCTMVEALPAARHMAEAGYTVFLMTYRVGIQKAAFHALDDLAAAVRYLGIHGEALGIDPARYAIGGFSAGANLVSNWGSAFIGYKHYGLPKPICMFPIYTYIDIKAESQRDENGGLIAPMLGENWRDLLNRFHLPDQINGDYPPCYLVCGKDDQVVPCSNSELMKEKLDAAGVPAILEEADHAPHGFGDGTGTEVEGWPERALKFMESLL